MIKSKTYYVYIIKAARTSKKNFNKLVFYTGMTNDPKRRFKEHCNKIKSNWMRINRIIPLGIVYLEKVDDYRKALDREREIKRLPLIEKLKMIKEY